MGQSDILKFLKGKDYLKISEIAIGVDVVKSNVSVQVKKLWEDGLLDRKNIGIGRQEFYSYRLRNFEDKSKANLIIRNISELNKEGIFYGR